MVNINDIPEKDVIASCPYRNKDAGFSKHCYIKEHPRLLNEVPRGTKRYKKIKNLRSSSERINSSLKDDLKILNDPVVTNLSSASALGAMANITLFVKRIMDFITRIHVIKAKLKKPLSSKQICEYRIKLHPKTVPKSIASLIQPHPVFGNCSV